MWAPGRANVLLVVSAVVAMVGVGIITSLRMDGGMNGHPLGWMSEQWLAQHRASTSP